MYLLVFVTLIISLIGLYTQILSVQTARLFANQNGVGRAMLQWQAAAISMAASIVNTNRAGYAPFAGTGCSLSIDVPAGMNVCPSPLNPPTIGAPVVSLVTGLPVTGTVTDAAGNINTIYNINSPAADKRDRVRLSPDYNRATYRFYSILYNTGGVPLTGQNLVVTFVPQAAVNANCPAPNFLCLPGPLAAAPSQIGLTGSDLIQQLQNTRVSAVTYGTVSGAGTELRTRGVPPYPVPPGIVGMGNAIAVVGSSDGF